MHSNWSPVNSRSLLQVVGWLEPVFEDEGSRWWPDTNEHWMQKCQANEHQCNFDRTQHRPFVNGNNNEIFTKQIDMPRPCPYPAMPAFRQTGKRRREQWSKWDSQGSNWRHVGLLFRCLPLRLLLRQPPVEKRTEQMSLLLLLISEHFREHISWGKSRTITTSY